MVGQLYRETWQPSITSRVSPRSKGEGTPGIGRDLMVRIERMMDVPTVVE